jgi:lipopolysaccharide transport system permease protein
MAEIGTPGFSLDGRPTPLRTIVSATLQSRELITILARKDFYVRYRRATFGLLWAAALPLLQALVLAYVVSRFATFETRQHYAVFVLSGTVAWSTFSAIVSAGSTAIVDGSGLSTKIYFPRIVLPLVTVWASSYFTYRFPAAATAIAMSSRAVTGGPRTRGRSGGAAAGPR